MEADGEEEAEARSSAGAGPVPLRVRRAVVPRANPPDRRGVRARAQPRSASGCGAWASCTWSRRGTSIWRTRGP